MSQPPQIQPKLATPNPGLKDLLDAHKIDILQSFNCHAIATINSITQNETNGLLLVNASLNYSKTYFNRLPNGTYQAQLVNYTQLLDCPLIVLGGGATSISFPVKAGDQCLILFNDRDMSNWQQQANGFAGPVATPRLHSFTDAIALVGFIKVSNYDPDHALLSNGNAEVGVPATTSGAAAAKVRIANQSTTLYTLLSNLITAIEAITVTTVVPSTPGTYTSGTPNNSSSLDAARTALQGLLE